MFGIEVCIILVFFFVILFFVVICFSVFLKDIFFLISSLLVLYSEWIRKLKVFFLDRLLFLIVDSVSFLKIVVMNSGVEFVKLLVVFKFDFLIFCIWLKIDNSLFRCFFLFVVSVLLWMISEMFVFVLDVIVGMKCDILVFVLVFKRCNGILVVMEMICVFLFIYGCRWCSVLIIFSGGIYIKIKWYVFV